MATGAAGRLSRAAILAGVTVAGVSVVAACGSDDDDTTTADAGADGSPMAQPLYGAPVVDGGGIGVVMDGSVSTKDAGDGSADPERDGSVAQPVYGAPVNPVTP